MLDDPILETEATYDRLAPHYAKRWDSRHVPLLSQMDRFVQCLPAGGVRVLDAGCGPGRDLKELKKRGLTAIGLDRSIGMLRTGDLSDVVQGDLRQLPFVTGGFDGVWCHATLLHVPRPMASLVLSEFHRVLRQSGVLHLGVAEGDGERWEDVDYGPTERLRRWYVYYSLAEIQQHLQSAGFDRIKVARHSDHRCWLYLLASRKEGKSRPMKW